MAALTCFPSCGVLAALACVLADQLAQALIATVISSVTGKRTGMGRVSRDSSVICDWKKSLKRIALRGPLSG